MEKREQARRLKTPQKRRIPFFQSGSIDVIFCCLVLLLFAVGLVMMYSASYAFSQSKFGTPIYYFKKQLIIGAGSIVIMFIISRIDYRILNSILTPILSAFVILLLFIAVIKGGGDGINRWINLGFAQFQPSEAMKFVIVLDMAYMLCILYETLRTRGGKTFTPKRAKLTNGEKFLYYFIDTPGKASFALLVVCAMCTLFVLIGKHLSGAIIVMLVGLCMMWVGGANKKLLVAIGVCALVGAALVVWKPEILKVFSNYACERVQVWKAKQTVGQTTYWQTQQGLFAIGSGGPFGVGFGNSKQKLLYVPEPQNDFVFSICCEELGYVGAILILLLFAAMIARGFMISAKTTDYFGSLLVVGIMIQVGIQVILNIAVVTDTIPNTGVPLPFFSYGGTAIFMIFAQMGVVLSVSRKSYLEKE